MLGVAWERAIGSSRLMRDQVTHAFDQGISKYHVWRELNHSTVVSSEQGSISV